MSDHQHQMKHLCDRVFLLNPQAIARENAQIDYVVVRFSETETQVITEVLIVDPEIPNQGTFADWLRLEQYQQLNVGFTMKAAELLKTMGDQLVVFNGLQRRGESREDFAQRMEKLNQEPPWNPE